MNNLHKSKQMLFEKNKTYQKLLIIADGECTCKKGQSERCAGCEAAGVLNEMAEMAQQLLLEGSSKNYDIKEEGAS